MERNSWECGAHNRTKVRYHRECQECGKPFHIVERQFTLFVTIHFPSKAPHSISGVLSTAYAFLFFPFSSVVLHCNVTKSPSLQTMSSQELPKDRTTVRGHRMEPASTFHSSLQLIPHVISALTASKNKWLENKSSTKH